MNNKPVESGDELPDAVEMNKTVDISDPTNVRSNTTMEMDIDTDLDNNNNTSSSKMGKPALFNRKSSASFSCYTFPSPPTLSSSAAAHRDLY